MAISEVPPARRSPYGDHEDQVVDVYLPAPGSPARPGPHPVVILLHGGCWRSAVDRTYFGQFARALGEHGVASCNVGYRRLGTGGGCPQTFEDVAAAADMVANLAEDVPLDLSRVVAVGHSAGGHLALWLAARRYLPPDAPGASASALPIRGVLALAGIPDLAAAHERGVCGSAIAELLGGDPRDNAGVLAWASPSELPPVAAPHVHMVGEFDSVVPPEYLEACVADMRSRGQDTRMKILAGCGHMEPVVAGAPPWAEVLAAVQELAGDAI